MVTGSALDTNYQMTIGGRVVKSERWIDVINPATGRVFARAPNCTQAELDEAVAAARSAFQTWRNVDVQDRQARLREAGDVLLANGDELASLFTREQGRPLAGAKREITMAANWFHTFATMAPPVEIVEDSADQFIETRYHPLGVICGISPWNFPVLLSAFKIAPALVTGNTLVLKPSPFTPLCVLKIGELLRDVFPAGVLNVISGDDELGPRMTNHAGFAKISFTGSTAVGRQIMEAAGKTLKKITLELGGNDAAIVLPDVDPAKVAQRIFYGAFANTGQICIATKRLYVHDAIYDDLMAHLRRLAATTKVGDGTDADTILGPIQNKRQYERVLDLIDDARKSGVTLIEGSRVPEEGYFVPITIADNPPEDSRVVQEEAFGPVLPVLRFHDVDEVIKRVNASDFGLAGSVWSADIEAAQAIGRRMEAGTIWINQNLNMRPDTAFAGWKQSGVGVENGMGGLLEYVVSQSTYLAREAGV